MHVTHILHTSYLTIFVLDYGTVLSVLFFVFLAHILHTCTCNYKQTLHYFYEYLFWDKFKYKTFGSSAKIKSRIGDVMVIVLTLFAIDGGFEPKTKIRADWLARNQDNVS